MWPFHDISTKLMKREDGDYNYKIDAKILKISIDENFWQRITDNEVMIQVSKMIANDIYKEIRGKVIANRKFKKEILNKVIIELVKSNKEQLKTLLNNN